MSIAGAAMNAYQNMSDERLRRLRQEEYRIKLGYLQSQLGHKKGTANVKKYAKGSSKIESDPSKKGPVTGGGVSPGARGDTDTEAYQYGYDRAKLGGSSTRRGDFPEDAMDNKTYKGFKPRGYAQGTADVKSKPAPMMPKQGRPGTQSGQPESRCSTDTECYELEKKKAKQEKRPMDLKGSYLAKGTAKVIPKKMMGKAKGFPLGMLKGK